MAVSRLLGLWASLLILGMAGLASGAAAGEIALDRPLELVIDKSQLIRLPDRVATIVLGNPLIADASLQAGGVAVLTGKGYGATNLIALDRSGQVLLEKTVLVAGPDNGDIVVVYKGVNRETYSCAPDCQPRITLGDGMQFFSQTLTQTGTRNSQAVAIGAR